MDNRTLTRLYDNRSQASETVRALEAAGIPHDDISLVGHESDRVPNTAGSATADDSTNEAGPGAGIGAGLGAVAGGGAGVLAGLGMLAIPGIGPVVAAGWLVSLIAGAASGAVAGGLLGGLVGSGVGREHAEVYAEGVRRGGTLVLVRCPPGRESEVTAILDRHAVDPDRRREDYQSRGWSRYDPDAAPLSQAELDRERAFVPR